jgi:hypothetical protein
MLHRTASATFHLGMLSTLLRKCYQVCSGSGTKCVHIESGLCMSCTAAADYLRHVRFNSAGISGATNSHSDHSTMHILATNADMWSCGHNMVSSFRGAACILIFFVPHGAMHHGKGFRAEMAGDFGSGIVGSHCGNWTLQLCCMSGRMVLSMHGRPWLAVKRHGSILSMQDMCMAGSSDCGADQQGWSSCMFASHAALIYLLILGC